MLARELEALQLSNVRADNGFVRFDGDFSALTRANIWCRTADRIWWEVGNFEATTFEALFEGVRKLPWPSILCKDANFPVSGHIHNSQLSSLPAVQSIVKKAIVENLKAAYSVQWFGEDGPSFPIRVTLVKNVATISIDSSGSGLHRRGYRHPEHEAPIRETLAAGMILLSYWNAERLLVDPFCGSGTILLEAASIGLNRAPGWLRSFNSEQWPCLPQRYWTAARQEMNDLYRADQKLRILGSDSDERSVAMSEQNFHRAQLPQGSLSVVRRPFSEFRIREDYGVLITNPPYGERLSSKAEVEELYQQMGQIFGPRLATWSLYVITSHPDFARLFGHKESRKRKLYNGLIACNYYQYLGPRPPVASTAPPPPARSATPKDSAKRPERHSTHKFPSKSKPPKGSER